MAYPKQKDIYDSMSQAAAAMGISMDTLRHCKRLGCLAFRPGGRVDGKALLAWISANPLPEPAASEEEPSGLKDQKTSEEIRKLRIRNDRDEGQLVKRSEVAGAVTQCASRISAILHQKLENEYPALVAGIEAPQARVYGKRLADDIMREFQKLADAWKL